MSLGYLPRERIKTIVEREIATRHRIALAERGAGGDPWAASKAERVLNQKTGLSMLLDDLRAAGIKSANRWIYTVRNGVGENAKANGVATGEHVSFATVDRFLCALGLEYLWHTELADLYYGEEAA